MAARTSRPWRRAAAIALALHAVLFTLAIRSVKIRRPAPEPQAIGLQLIQLQPLAPRRERLRAAKTTPSSARAAATPAASPAVAAPAARAAAAPQPSGSGDAAGRVRAMLRGSTGCDSAAFLKLSQAEQQKCARWRTAQVDPNLQIPPPIDPVKKSWFDADLRYRDLGRRMPFGPPGLGKEASEKLTHGQPPGHGAHVGPFIIGLPGGAFNDDDAPPP